MTSDLIFSLREVEVCFGKKQIFHNLDLNIHRGDLIALVGKNGIGKTTLMKIIEGSQDLDSGEVWQYPGMRVSYFSQQLDVQDNKTIETELESIIQSEKDKYKIDIYCDNLNLTKSSSIKNLSGGQKRRVALIKSLIPDSDILLLDEPTNHFDLECIMWLENHLKNLNRVIICVSHDRTFLCNFTNKVFWLDRGNLRVSPKGFRNFVQWTDELLDQEARELRNRKQFVNLEVEWANRGVKARVKRNIKRLQRAKQLKEQLEKDEASYRSVLKSIKFHSSKKSSDNSKFIAEFYKVSVSYDNNSRKVLENVSVKISKNDRIGLLGKNGTGKSTFLRTLLGEVKCLHGKIKIKKNMDFSYFDQLRNDLNGQKSLKNILVPSGGDYLKIQGKQRHVCSYLKDFQFDPKRANDTIHSLSGGQRNRLLLAKVLANPKTGLILDEPTNDLDLDTMDLLTEMLSKYKGTLLIVSHDRDFLDQTVNKILHFEGNGKISLFLGGYNDFLKNQENFQQKKFLKNKKTNSKHIPQSTNKISYKFKFELEKLPTQIKEIQQRIAKINNQLKDTNLYINNFKEFTNITEEMSYLENQLLQKENRWLELAEMEEMIHNSNE